MEGKEFLIAIIAGLGIKEIWNIWKKYIDNRDNKSQFYRKRDSERVVELENKVEELMTQLSEYKVRIGVLEERLLHISKNRFKKKRNGEEK